VKVRVVDTEGNVYEYPDVRSGGWLEFRTDSGDPDLPSKHWLDDVVSLEVEGQPVPVVQNAGEAPPESEWDVSIYGSDGKGGFARVGPLKTVKRAVPTALLPKGLREPYPGVAGAPRLPKRSPKPKAAA
jgi:hypothetical protein